MNTIPRVGAAVALDKDRNATIRGGWGYFYERTPLMTGAFPQLADVADTSYAADGVTPLGPPVVFTHKLGADLQTPRSSTWNLGYEHRVTPWASLRANFLQREGRHELVLDTTQDGHPAASSR